MKRGGVDEKGWNQNIGANIWTERERESHLIFPIISCLCWVGSSGFKWRIPQRLHGPQDDLSFRKLISRERDQATGSSGKRARQFLCLLTIILCVNTVGASSVKIFIRLSSSVTAQGSGFRMKCHALSDFRLQSKKRVILLLGGNKCK